MDAASLMPAATALPWSILSALLGKQADLPEAPTLLRPQPRHLGIPTSPQSHQVFHPADQHFDGSSAIHALTSLAADRLQQPLLSDGRPGTSAALSGSPSPSGSPPADPGTSSTGAAVAWPAVRRPRSHADVSGSGIAGRGHSRRLSSPEADHVELDEREAKRAKRMQSNRESARRSRMRKQAECEELAAMVAQLSAEKAALAAENHGLRLENTRLQAENSALQDMQLQGPSRGQD